VQYSRRVWFTIKLVTPISLYLRKNCNNVSVDKNMFDKFPIRNGLKQGDDLSSFLVNVDAYTYLAYLFSLALKQA
jgi:hypothetical protein